MSEVAREILDHSFGGNGGDAELNMSSDSFSPERSEDQQQMLTDFSTYTLASDQSVLSRDVDLWIRGSPDTNGVQGSGVQTQRSTTISLPTIYSNGMWYILAILPFFSINNYTHWRCSPSLILNSAELLLSNLASLCERLRCSIRRLAENQMSRELLATAMDVVLFIYAMGFLVLSMYQASIIG